jgi:hypothetical protein
MGLTWAINPNGFKHTIRDIADNKGVLLILGMFALTAGYLILAVRGTPSLLITLLGWIALLKGFAVIVLSSADFNVSSLLKKLRIYYAAIPWLVLVVGIIFFVLGYLA